MSASKPTSAKSFISQVYDLLARHSRQQKVLYLSGEPLEVLKAQKVSPHCDRVFVDDDGAPLRYDAMIEDFQQACKRAKIVDGFTDADNGSRLPGFHDLRRTFARVANRTGVPQRNYYGDRSLEE